MSGPRQVAVNNFANFFLITDGIESVSATWEFEWSVLDASLVLTNKSQSTNFRLRQITLNPNLRNDIFIPGRTYSLRLVVTAPGGARGSAIVSVCVVYVYMRTGLGVGSVVL